jgi:hypothetical protein
VAESGIAGRSGFAAAILDAIEGPDRGSISSGGMIML